MKTGFLQVNVFLQVNFLLTPHITERLHFFPSSLCESFSTVAFKIINIGNNASSNSDSPGISRFQSQSL